MSQTLSGLDSVIMRLVARALAGADHLEARRARPVDVLADQRRLVAPCQRIDDVRGPGLAGEQRPGHRVGLDIDHNDVFSVGDGLQAMLDAGARHAGRLNDDLDLRIGNQRSGVFGDKRRAPLVRVGERCGGIRLRRPIRRLELAARPRDVEIGNADHVSTGGQPRLR